MWRSRTELCQDSASARSRCTMPSRSEARAEETLSSPAPPSLNTRCSVEREAANSAYRRAA